MKDVLSDALNVIGGVLLIALVCAALCLFAYILSDDNPANLKTHHFVTVKRLDTGEIERQGEAISRWNGNNYAGIHWADRSTVRYSYERFLVEVRPL